MLNRPACWASDRGGGQLLGIGSAETLLGGAGKLMVTSGVLPEEMLRPILARLGRVPRRLPGPAVADDVGSSAQFSIQALPGIRAPDLAPDLRWHGGEGEQVAAGFGQVRGRGGELAVQCGHDPVELGVHLGGVGWSKMVRTSVATHGWLVLLTLVRRSRR